MGIAKKADVNKDGLITQTEARTHLSEKVDQFMLKRDVNHDGMLDPAERKRKIKPSSSAKTL